MDANKRRMQKAVAASRREDARALKEYRGMPTFGHCGKIPDEPEKKRDWEDFKITCCGRQMILGFGGVLYHLTPFQADCHRCDKSILIKDDEEASKLDERKKKEKPSVADVVCKNCGKEIIDVQGYDGQNLVPAFIHKESGSAFCDSKYSKRAEKEEKPSEAECREWTEKILSRIEKLEDEKTPLTKYYTKEERDAIPKWINELKDYRTDSAIRFVLIRVADDRPNRWSVQFGEDVLLSVFREKNKVMLRGLLVKNRK